MSILSEYERVLNENAALRALAERQPCTFCAPCGDCDWCDEHKASRALVRELADALERFNNLPAEQWVSISDLIARARALIADLETHEP